MNSKRNKKGNKGKVSFVKKGFLMAAILLFFSGLVFVVDVSKCVAILGSQDNLLADNSGEGKSIEKCYIKLKIGEKLKSSEETAGSSNIVFSLKETDSLYGVYDNLVEKYYEDSDYVLKTYNRNGKLLGKYSLYSSRFILWDNFSESGSRGGVKELESGTITAVIPYDNKIQTIKVEHKGKETDLQINLSELKCEKTCKTENEEGSYEQGEKCCTGLIPATQPDGSFVCVKCGDSICSKYEDRHSCPEDCGPGGQKKDQGISQSSEEGGGKGGAIIIGVIASVIAILLVAGYLFIKKRKRGDI